MSREIYISPDEVWASLGNEDKKVVAYNDENMTNIEVFRSMGATEIAVVSFFDGVLASTIVDCDTECENTIKNYIEEFINVDNEVEEYVDISDRELELSDAVSSMLSVFSPAYEDECDSEKAVEDLKGIVCTYLWDVHGVSIYRPMKVEVSGVEVVEDYPYDYICK